MPILDWFLKSNCDIIFILYPQCSGECFCERQRWEDSRTGMGENHTPLWIQPQKLKNHKRHHTFPFYPPAIKANTSGSLDIKSFLKRGTIALWLCDFIAFFKNFLFYTFHYAYKYLRKKCLCFIIHQCCMLSLIYYFKCYNHYINLIY